MRKIKRNMARERMKEAGLTNINRKRTNKKTGKTYSSLFARNWRNFVFPPKRKKIAEAR